MFTPSPLPSGSEVLAILGDEAAMAVTADTPDFWALAAALRAFVAGEGAGQPPLEGSLPDMHATTQRYLSLQGTYRAKADADTAAVGAHLSSLLKAAGRDPGAIPPAEVRRFCRHARQLRVVRTPPAARGVPPDALRGALGAEDTAADASLLVLLRAVDRFQGQHQRLPGRFDQGLDEDVAVLKGLAAAVLLEGGVTGAGVCDDLVGEVVRCGGGELQVVAAVVGAMASQEAIKLLTGQFVPLGGTLIYNAMHCTTTVFKG